MLFGHTDFSAQQEEGDSP